MAHKIFISYRRGSDSTLLAELVEQKLRTRFGVSSVYRDFNSVKLGENYMTSIQKALNSADVLVVIVANNFMVAEQGGNGYPRIWNPSDLVRLEIETAIERGVLLVPVLAENTRMPSLEQLPPSLHPMANTNGLQLRYDRLPEDSQRLIALVQERLEGSSRKRKKGTAKSNEVNWLKRLFFIVLLLIIATFLIKQVTVY